MAAFPAVGAASSLAVAVPQDAWFTVRVFGGVLGTRGSGRWAGVWGEWMRPSPLRDSRLCYERVVVLHFRDSLSSLAA